MNLRRVVAEIKYDILFSFPGQGNYYVYTLLLSFPNPTNTNKKGYRLTLEAQPFDFM